MAYLLDRLILQVPGSIQGAKGDQLQALRSFQNSLRLPGPERAIGDAALQTVGVLAIRVGFWVPFILWR